jgi:hypothetical protein
MTVFLALFILTLAIAALPILLFIYFLITCAHLADMADEIGD